MPVGLKIHQLLIISLLRVAYIIFAAFSYLTWLLTKRGEGALGLCINNMSKAARVSEHERVACV